jgi:hypothetical protein
MQAVSHLVKESLPNYLRDLPIPDSVLGKIILVNLLQY